MDAPRAYDMGDGERENSFRSEFVARLDREDPDKVLQWLHQDARGAEFPDTLLHLAGLALKYADRYQEARRSLEEALERRRHRGNDRMTAATLVLLSQIETDQGSYDAAWQLLDEALRLAPDFLTVHLNRLSTADVERNAPRLERAFEEMKTYYSGWDRDSYLIEKLLSPTWILLHKLPGVWAEITSLRGEIR